MPNRTGSYVEYKGVAYIITEDNGAMVKILNPLVGNNKLNVKRTSVKAMRIEPAVITEYKSARYLVTLKECIISLATGKVMQWGPTNGVRIAILNNAGFIG